MQTVLLIGIYKYLHYMQATLAIVIETVWMTLFLFIFLYNLLFKNIELSTVNSHAPINVLLNPGTNNLQMHTFEVLPSIFTKSGFV